MARANRQAFYELLTSAYRRTQESPGKFWRNLERVMDLPFPDSRRLQVVHPLVYRFREKAFLALEVQDFRDLSDLLSSVFNLQDPERQASIIQNLEREFPGISWRTALATSEEEGDRSSDEASDFVSSRGPELLEKVEVDSFRSLLSEAFGSREVYSTLEEEVLSDIKQRGELLRVLHWAMRLFLELRSRAAQVARKIPGFCQFAVGFLNPVTEKDAFGVIALVLSHERPAKQFIDLIEVNNRKFPIVVRSITLTEHASPTVHPSNGTATCWAKSRVSTPLPQEGILTAKHVTGTRLQARVKFNGGGVGRLVDMAPEGIDAAVVDTPETFPRSPMRMRTIAAVAPWTDVEFTGAGSGGLHRTKVTAVTDILGILSSPLLPVRVVLANHGSPGDSGALVLEPKTSKAVGLYMAEFSDQAGRSGGLAQHMEQVVQIMDMELYR